MRYNNFIQGAQDDRRKDCQKDFSQSIHPEATKECLGCW
jgi:hypothetical protein